MNLTELQLEGLERETTGVVDKLKKVPIIETILVKLRKELPKNLKYHNGVEKEDSETPTHTEDVLHDTILFALADRINDEHSLELLGIMASFHDAGFLRQYHNNEEICAQMAVEAMRADGKYSEDDCTIVDDGIIATKIEMVEGVLRQRKTPNNLAGYLLDGDVSNLGKSDFRHKSDLILEELMLQYPDEPPDKTAFLTSAYHFIASHQWNTPAAKKLLLGPQQDNIKALGKELGIVV